MNKFLSQQGDVKLPDRADMMEEVQQKKQAMAARYVKTQRHTIQVDWIPFMDELAELVGSRPDLSKSGLCVKCALKAYIY